MIYIKFDKIFLMILLKKKVVEYEYLVLSVIVYK